MTILRAEDSQFANTGTYELIKRVMTTLGTTKIARINALAAILKAAEIDTVKIHSPSCLPLINAIRYLLTEKGIREYLQEIIDNPGFIKLDPVIEEIFNGKYLLLNPEVQSSTAQNVHHLIADAR